MRGRENCLSSSRQLGLAEPFLLWWLSFPPTGGKWIKKRAAKIKHNGGKIHLQARGKCGGFGECFRAAAGNQFALPTPPLSLSLSSFPLCGQEKLANKATDEDLRCVCE